MMKPDLSEDTIQVSLPASFVYQLLKVHEAFEIGVIEALRSSVGDKPPSNPVVEPTLIEAVIEPSPKKYSAEFLGVGISAWTLPEVYAQIVDLMGQAAPDALEKLATFRSRKRRYLARSPGLIHPDNEYLPVMQTTSGWWISKNIGQEDLKRSLRALAGAAGLTFGRDVIFPVNRVP